MKTPLAAPDPAPARPLSDMPPGYPRRNPAYPDDPYAVPYLTGSSWYDYSFGPLCRRLAAIYGIEIDDTVTPIPTTPTPQLGDNRPTVATNPTGGTERTDDPGGVVAHPADNTIATVAADAAERERCSPNALKRGSPSVPQRGRGRAVAADAPGTLRDARRNPGPDRADLARPGQHRELHGATGPTLRGAALGPDPALATPPIPTTKRPRSANRGRLAG